MADYYPLIARAVAGLDASATGEQRRALYERARTALIAQLRGVTPPLSESEITRERLTLEEAIRKVEQEAAQRARGARADAFVRRGGDGPKGAAPRGPGSGAAAPATDRPSTRADRERSRPIPERDDGPMIRPRSPESRDLDWDETPAEPRGPTAADTTSVGASASAWRTQCAAAPSGSARRAAANSAARPERYARLS